MTIQSLSHLSDASVERGLVERAARERLATAELLQYLAEFDARRLYRQHLLHSTFEFCLRVLGLSEDMACKRIAVARDARSYPGLLRRIADGSLHLTGAAMLSQHLTPGNAEELLEAAAHKGKAEIERVLAERFPKPDLPTRLVPLVPEGLVRPVAAPEPAGTGAPDASPDTLADSAPEIPAVPNLDNSPVPERVNLLVPRPSKSTNPRHIPAAVKREVWMRDRGRCTFVGENGRRCESREWLELDHEVPVARGGQPRTANLRLRCRMHNRMEAERTYGAEFMRHKRRTVPEAASRTPPPPTPRSGSPAPS